MPIAARKKQQTEKPLLPFKTITAGLDKIETPLIQSQTQVITQAKNRLLAIALPLVEAKDTASIAALDWQAGVALQRPIYAIWEQGYLLGGLHMQQAVKLAIPNTSRTLFSGVPESVEHYALSPDVVGLLTQFLSLDPGQLVASAVQAAVLNRAIQLAGSFAQSQLAALKQDLIAAIIPQSDTGEPISRTQLLKRIESTLSVGKRRAENIARTELTNAYNRGRVQMGLQSELVDAFRFLTINDTRTTEICRSRDGMIIERTDTAGLAGNTPALHYKCRSTLSPILTRVNRSHRAMFNDPSRRRQNRELAALLPGWS